MFLHKIFEHSEPLYDPNSVYGYNKIYRNSEMIEKFFTKKTQLHEISSPLQFEPFILYIKIISAHNLDALNKGTLF